MDTAQHRTESENERSNLISDDDINFNPNHNLGFFRHNSSLNSTVPQNEGTNRSDYIFTGHNREE